MATINIPDEFLHANSEEHIIIVLKGDLALLMWHVDPKFYRKYIIFDNRGKPVLYFKMLKSLYRLIGIALLFHRKLVKDLHKYGLKMDP